MPITKLSSKYQIVIPRDVRRQLKLTAGQKMYIYPINEDRAVLAKEPSSYVKAMRGLGKEVWESLGGGEEYIKQERASWER